MFASNPEQLRSLAAWLVEQEVEEAVMESTAQYWKPVWETLEQYWKPIREKREGAGRMSGRLHLAQAQPNRGRRGRKRDFPDAERLVKRLVARELTLSFVPDAERCLWRTVTGSSRAERAVSDLYDRKSRNWDHDVEDNRIPDSAAARSYFSSRQGIVALTSDAAHPQTSPVSTLTDAATSRY